MHIPNILISFVEHLTSMLNITVIEQSDSSELIQKIGNNISDLSGLFKTIWNFNLFTAKGSAIQVNQVVIAILLLIIGLIVSRWLTHRLRKYLQVRTQLDESSASFLQRITFYIFLIIIVLSTLQMIGLPITMFAFIGGAIIIGIGFGTQNIFNNFISGIILMIERPIRIGDLIEVDSHLGRVDEVGARCTRIRRTDGIELLVPNSKLLESNVINRTLSDKMYRTSVSVGVAYGSPTRQVVEIIQRIVDEYPSILQNPKPQVFFHEFGSSSLDFETLFWVEVDTTLQIRRIRSDIRLQIDDSFREAGIVIAFPQQDVHLDTHQPLSINIVNSNLKREQNEQLESGKN